MNTVIKNAICWRRYTTLKKSNTLTFIFALIAVIALASGLTEGLKTTTTDKRTQFCLTEECIRTALAVMGKMKTEIKPCDDFYQFACGTYIDETPIPEDRAYIEPLSTIWNELQIKLLAIVEEERAESDPKYLKSAHTFYKACMNEALIENLGAKPIQQISERLGGWPVIDCDCWDSDDSWTWQGTVKKLRRFGLDINTVFRFSIDVDQKNNTKRIIRLDQPSIGLDREYLFLGFNNTIVSAYYDYMVDTAVLFGADIGKAKWELRKSLQFEIDLARICWPNIDRRNITKLYNLRSIKQLQESYPYVQWLDYINAMLPKNITVNEDEIVNLLVPSFFEKLGKLLERTKKRDIANYMFWRIHEEAVVSLSEKFQKRKMQYTKVVSGQKQQEARWKMCLKLVSKYFGAAVGSQYVRKHFKEDSKDIALNMVDNIRAAFSQILNNTEWMDSKTRQEAKKKLSLIKPRIGYADELLQNDVLTEYYRKLKNIHPDKYFKSLLETCVFVNDAKFNKLRLPVIKDDWSSVAYPMVVNAYYSVLQNSIQFPAGILQGSLFNSQRPKFMNYGSIGFVIGHEITHGFDTRGHMFDGNGNSIDWWQPETKKAYLEKVKCIIEQYGNYTDKQTGLKLNGLSTQNENIADNGGLKASYLAYTQWLAQNGEEPPLPGLNYTSKQMFWISAAQTWCGKYRNEALKQRINTGVHTTFEFRILGPLRNMKDFSSDFQCAEGTPMNPLQKCEVW